MSYTASRKQIAVVIPKNRAWKWHDQLVSILQESFEVDVYSSAAAPPYPQFVRFWLRLELWFLGRLTLVELSRVSARPWEQRSDANYSLVLNLSEGPIHQDDPIAEARYQGSSDSLNLITALLAGQNPFLSFHLDGHEAPLTTSYLAIADRIVLARALQSSFARLLALAERAVARVINHTDGAVLSDSPIIPPVLSFTNMSRFCLQFALDKFFWSFVRRLQRTEHWSIIQFQLEDQNITRRPTMRQAFSLLDDGQRFYADPFLFADGGKKWLFFEEYSYRTAKGIISCAQVTDEGGISSLHPVLERPYHLSYPFVFREGREIYMIPESGSNKTVELYRAESFPFRWVFDRNLLENIALYDATVLRHQNRFWLFGAASYHGAAPQDELVAFYAERLAGPWHPHQLNPVKSDCRSARPAGRVVLWDNRLFRPAQDCELGYGTALVWCEITELAPDRYSEREIGRWNARELLGADGIHTFDWEDATAVIDAKYTIWKYSFLRALKGWGKTVSPGKIALNRLRSEVAREIAIATDEKLTFVPGILDDVAVVVIGRNEGERLVACLASVKSETSNIVYVDSGSRDGSTAVAEKLGAKVVSLDPARPFTAARARNEGLRTIKALKSNIRFIQFVDGDCILVPGWLSTAVTFVLQHKNVAIVFGRLWEQYPTKSVYNQLCDIEWDTPIGEALACGGNSLIRVEALDAVGGFRPELIGGEEPELCLRIREEGRTIWRLKADMAQHDAAITRFGQWWMRSVRSGWGLTEIWLLHRTSPLNIWRRDVASVVFWGSLLPAVIILAALLHPIALSGILVYPIQIGRIAVAQGADSRRSWIYAVFIMLAKFAYFQGILKFFWARLRNRGRPTIQYK